MSFAVATIYKGTYVFIATDSQLTGSISGRRLHNISKIAPISQSTAIGMCGTFDFCKLAIEVLKIRIERSCDSIKDAKDIETEIMSDIHNADRLWTQKHFNVAPEAVLLIAGFNGPSPYISAIAVSNHKVDLIHDVAPAGSYQFIPSSPPDINTYECIRLCTRHLSQECSADKPPKSHLESLVKLVASESDMVDDQVEVWQGLLPKPRH